ncbi:hypothetical protein Tco_1518922, partial [Tanacetum coccineum]
MNTTQAQQKALDDALVAPADRLEFRKCNMRLKTKTKRSYISNRVGCSCSHSLLPCFPDHFICSYYLYRFRHSGDINYLTDVNVDYLHQPWRAFATVINKCLSGKETGMDKICLSRSQILWVDPDTSPKQSKAKVAKSDKKKQPINKPKAKGLAVLSE